MLLVLGLIMFSVLFIFLLIYQIKYKHLIDVTRNIASAPALPLIGHAHYFIGQPAHIMLMRIVELVLKYSKGHTLKIWLGPELNIIMGDVNDVEVVLGSTRFNDKAREYKSLEPWLREGLLISRGQKWHNRRKIITPAFHFKKLDTLIHVFEQKSREMVRGLQHEFKVQPPNGIALYDWISLCTLDIICVSFEMLLGLHDVALLVITIVTFIIYKRKYAPIMEKTKNWPSAPTLPLLGHAHYFICSNGHETLTRLAEMMKKYSRDGYLKLWLGTELNLLVNNVKDLEVIMGTSNFNEKSSHYKYLESWLKDGLLISRTQKWFQRRKALTPAFHFKILSGFVEIFEKQSKNLLEKLKTYEIGKEDCELYKESSLCTLDIICESAMGVSVNAQTHADSDYVKAVKTISTVLHKRMFDIFYRFDITYQFTKLASEEKRALAILHGFTERIIIQRREELLKSQQAAGDSATKSQNDDVGAKRKMAFLDILLQSEIDGKPLSNLDIREEVDTFMFEGHDTTSSAITFFFYNISKHPECQQKCFEEIVFVFGEDGSRPVNYETLNELHYIELCIRETLRLFPSVPILGRKVTQDVEINGKIIPAGTNIGISPLYLGRIEELFPEADAFKPERFEVGTSAEKLNPYAYIPFSAGPRNCIGQKFAMLEIKSVVTNVLRHFEIEYAGDPNVEPVLIAELILRTKDPLMFRIKRRTY